MKDLISRLRRFKGPNDGLGAYLGDGMNPGVRAGEIIGALENSDPETIWQKFIQHLNETEPLRSGPEHINFLGSIEKYKKIFLKANS